ncbi:MAG: hypothetical protein F4X59_14885 [Holophagales bacterium]|nr:hypothetical protein [Holophagales bacterium]MYC11397.1 hypothetical protein [Holophagales bacterium]
MNLFRLFLGVVFGVIVVYTVFVAMEHGLGLLGIFFGDIAAMTWNGQFNLDFLGFLTLSALWVAWRNGFSPGGLLLAVVALSFGVPFLTLYLFILSQQTNGDVKRMLLGDQRAAA